MCLGKGLPEQVSVGVLQQGGAQQVQVTQGGQVVVEEESFLHEQEGDDINEPTSNTNTAQTHKPSPRT